MKFDEEPNYPKLISLFDELIEPQHLRPIRIDGALKVIYRTDSLFFRTILAGALPIRTVSLFNLIFGHFHI